MRVLIIDDHPLYREGIKVLLSSLDPSIQVVGVSQVAQAQAEFNADGSDSPDLVLLDMNLPGSHHLQALQEVRSLFESASVVVISGEEDPALAIAAIDAGAAGFIPKSTTPEITIQALRLVLAQGVYLPAMTLLHGAKGQAKVPAPHFSEKQTAVLQRLLQGKSNKLIARELNIAEGTVKAHLWTVYQALGVNSRSQAMCRAYELGLLTR